VERALPPFRRASAQPRAPASDGRRGEGAWLFRCGAAWSGPVRHLAVRPVGGVRPRRQRATVADLRLPMDGDHRPASARPAQCERVGWPCAPRADHSWERRGPEARHPGREARRAQSVAAARRRSQPCRAGRPHVHRAPRPVARRDRAEPHAHRAALRHARSAARRAQHHAAPAARRPEACEVRAVRSPRAPPACGGHGRGGRRGLWEGRGGGLDCGPGYALLALKPDGLKYAPKRLRRRAPIRLCLVTQENRVPPGRASV